MKTGNVTVSIYRNGSFLTRMVGVTAAVARARAEEWVAGAEPWPPGRYEARLLSGKRAFKVYRWQRDATASGCD